jgi:hypothetical protein
VATVTQKRAKYLLRALSEMLDGADQRDKAKGLQQRLGTIKQSVRDEQALHDRANELLSRASAQNPPKLLDRFLQDPLIRSQAQRRTTGRVTRPPSYLSTESFVATVRGMLCAPDGTSTALGSAKDLLERLKGMEHADTTLGQVVSRLAAQEADEPTLTAALQQWYDDEMARVSGFYKRWIKRWILVISAVIVIVLHVDALSLGATLWSNPQVSQAAAALATPQACDAQKPATGTGNTEQGYLACLNQEQVQLHTAGLPIGILPGCVRASIAECFWPARPAPYGWQDYALVVIGLGMSVLAASLGAPFWFQVLTRAGSLRNTGPKPEPSNSA